MVALAYTGCPGAGTSVKDLSTSSANLNHITHECSRVVREWDCPLSLSCDEGDHLEKDILNFTTLEEVVFQKAHGQSSHDVDTVR